MLALPLCTNLSCFIISCSICISLNIRQQTVFIFCAITDPTIVVHRSLNLQKRSVGCSSVYSTTSIAPNQKLTFKPLRKTSQLQLKSFEWFFWRIHKTDYCVLSTSTLFKVWSQDLTEMKAYVLHTSQSYRVEIEELLETQIHLAQLLSQKSLQG